MNLKDYYFSFFYPTCEEQRETKMLQVLSEWTTGEGLTQSHKPQVANQKTGPEALTPTGD